MTLEARTMELLNKERISLLYITSFPSVLQVTYVFLRKQRKSMMQPVSPAKITKNPDKPGSPPT